MRGRNQWVELRLRINKCLSALQPCVELGPVGPIFVEHQTIGQGNLIRTGHRSVAATIAGQRFNLEGSLLGTYKVRMNLELNPLASEWNGRFRIDIALPNGQVIFTSDGRFEATPLPVEPL